MFMQLIPARLVTLYGNEIYRKISLLPSEIVKEIQNNVSSLELLRALSLIKRISRRKLNLTTILFLITFFFLSFSHTQFAPTSFLSLLSLFFAPFTFLRTHRIHSSQINGSSSKWLRSRPRSSSSAAYRNWARVSTSGRPARFWMWCSRSSHG